MQEGIVVSKPLRLLDSDEIQAIHDSIVKLLGKIGVIFEASWALDVLNAAGCTVDYKTKRVLIPEHLLEEAINRSPRTIRLCGRNPKYDLKLEGTRVYFGSGANAVNVVHYHSGGKFSSRPATVEDLKKFTILTDALENVHCFIPPVHPKDVPPKGVDCVKCEITFNYTEKHNWTDAEGYEGAINQYEMACAVAGGEKELRKRPILTLSPCVTSPFSWGEYGLGQLRACAEKSIPSIIASEPITGATAPATIAGSVTQGTAEVLSGFVLAHLINPGTPTLLCILPTMMDMRAGNVALGSIEMGQMNAVAAQVMREYYGLPFIGGGCLSESKIPDQQAGFEKALTILYAALGGCSIIHHTSGILEALLSESLEQSVIDNEILGIVMHGLRRVEVNEDTLAVDTIMKVGPSGHFLAEKHTLEHARKDLYIPKLADRFARTIWEKRGSKDIVERAHEKVQEILKTHQPEPLDEDIKKQLRQIREKAQKART